MNYKRNKVELSVIAEQISQYQFKRECLKIYSGANTIEHLTYAEWEERCKKLLHTFFTRDGESSGIILFPDREIAISQTHQTEIWKRAMSTLNVWCKMSSPKDATGLIIRNYDLEKHISLSAIKNHELEDTLAFKDCKNILSFQETNKRILAFNPSLKIIFIIRLVELQEGESQLLKKEVDYCVHEVNLLCFLLKDELADTGVIVTGLVAYSGENFHSQSACKDCGNIIVSFKIFDSVENFKAFYKVFINEKEFQDLAIGLPASKKKDKASLFQVVASKIVGYLAHLQFITLEKPILPLKKNNPTGDIKQAELLLDRYQMEIAYSNDKRVWLEGNYGTGKTVVALKKLELLCKGLEDKEVIYYVNFARESPLDFVIKQEFEKSGNVKAIKGENSLSSTVNLQILPKESEEGTKSIHLIIDEYNSQDLSTEEAKSLGQILTEEEKFMNSTVLIAAQPIEINRIDNFYEGGEKKQFRQFSQQKNELYKLIEITGMKRKMLRNVMRTTVEINTFAEITQVYLNDQSNQYVRQQQHDSKFNLPESEESRFQNTFSKLPQSSSSKLISSINNVSSDPSKSARTSPPFQSREVTYRGVDKVKSKKMNFGSSLHRTNPKQSTSSLENASPKSGSSAKVASDDSSNLVASIPPFQSQMVTANYYYQLHKFVPTAAKPTNSEDTGSYQETVTKYRYTCKSQIGHGINGPLPRLIKLGCLSDDEQQIALIASVLEKIISSENFCRKFLQLDDPPDWLKILFRLTNRLTMTTKTEEFLTDASKNLVLVKHFNFLRGLEFSDVLLILDSNEHHQRQFIPEAIARCRSNLSILIRPVHTTGQSDSVADLVDEWVTNNQDESIIDILEIGFCRKSLCNKKKYHQKVYCLDEKDSSYKVHQNNQDYLNFLKISRAYVQEIQLDHIKKLEEAKAL